MLENDTSTLSISPLPFIQFKPIHIVNTCTSMYTIQIIDTHLMYYMYLYLYPVSFSSIIKNPGDAEYLEVIAAGEAATWPFFSRIKAHCHVEMTLDR